MGEGAAPDPEQAVDTRSPVQAARIATTLITFILTLVQVGFLSGGSRPRHREHIAGQPLGKRE